MTQEQKKVIRAKVGCEGEIDAGCVTFDSVVQSDSSPPINERCQIKSKLLQLSEGENGWGRSRR